MMLGTSEIVGMTVPAKADLFATGARQMIERRYEATIALASLARSNGYLEAGFKSVEELAAKTSDLEPREVSEMLWVGRKLLDFPEMDEAFRDGRLNWTKVKTLVPHIKKDNAAEWIPKAIRMSSNKLAL